jgi:ATP-dependent DNA helicase RecQ
MVALTASATEVVAQDVMRLLEFKEGRVMRSSYARPNVSVVVRRCDDKKEQLSRVLSNVDGAAIVYVRSRERSVKVCEWLTEQGFSAQFYHAGLPHEERTLRQDEWQRGEKRIMVSTNAFGMGIDKRDVRAVVHYDMCSSLEAYYQEAGRAGRDGRRSFAVLLLEGDEERYATRRVESDFPPLELIKHIYDSICARMMIAYGEGAGVGREFNIYEFANAERLTVEQIKNSIKILAQNGYMSLSEERENSARLMFCVSREDLYDYRIRRGEMEGVLLAVMRLYEGVFTEFRPIDVQEIALHSGYSVEKVREELKHLWRQHIIRYVPSSYSPILTLLCDRVPKRDLFISPDSYIHRRASAEERMEAIMNYALMDDGCRSRYIQEYFGESGVGDCGACDLCLARRKGGSVGSAEVSAERVLEIIAERESVAPRDLVREFRCESSSVAEVVERLLEEEKIYTDRGGNLKIKR